MFGGKQLDVCTVVDPEVKTTEKQYFFIMKIPQFMQQRGLDWPGCFQDQARYAQRIPVV
jgi:hypothetical protein